MAERLVAAFPHDAALEARLARARDHGTVLEVRSGHPAAGDHGTSRRVGWAAFAGGVLGGAAALGTAAGSALAEPLVTGGMPIVAVLPVGLITAEGAALGVMLGTFLAVVWEGRLWRRRRPGPLDERLAAGDVVVTVETEGSVSELLTALRASGARAVVGEDGNDVPDAKLP